MSALTHGLTRQQRFMSLAWAHLTAVHAGDKETAKIYGGLCHSFPILVRSSGLCQALAFVEAKAAPGKARGAAYSLIADHLAAVLSIKRSDLVDTVRGAPVADYMRYTGAALDAWIFYKRFAVSILKVSSSQVAEDGQ